jgi:hypothetical protein
VSIGRLMNDIAKRELGLLSVFSSAYYFVFTDETKEVGHYKKLKQRLKADFWTDERLRKDFGNKTDDNGKRYITQYGPGILCYDPVNRQNYPIIKDICRVPKKLCKPCIHRGSLRGKYFCKLIRAKNKGLLAETIADAVSTVNKIMG